MDENYQCLKDKAYKTEQALENAFTEKEAQKAKLKSSYILFGKNDDEITSILLKIESNRENTGLPIDEEYNDAYWKWKDADEANEKAQIALKKYDENYNADIPDVMIELKEVKKEVQEVKDEMQRQNEESKRELLQQNEEVMKILNMLSIGLSIKSITFPNGDYFDGVLYYGKPHQGKMTFANGDSFEGGFQNGKPHQGKFIFANGDSFEGDFQNGKPHGKGKITFANGDQIERDFQDDFSNITPSFNGENEEVDIIFPEPVKARYITFKPKAWNGSDYVYLRCEVYVNNVLQNTPLDQRSYSSYDQEGEKDSRMNAYAWCPKKSDSNKWLKLDLQQRKTITGIRVGTNKSNASCYVSNLALEFGN